MLPLHHHERIAGGRRETLERVPACLAPSPCSPQAEAVRGRLRTRAEGNPPPPIEQVRDSDGSPRVSAVIVSHNRPELVLGTLHSLTHATSIPVDIVVVDNDSTAPTRQVLAEACAGHPQIRLHLSERNLGCVGGRRLGIELTESELVLFLDDDAELMPGALQHMLSALDRNPSTGAVSALVAIPDGRVSHSGGWYSESKEMVTFTLGACGLSFEDPEVPASGPCNWIPGTAPLIRRDLLNEFPLDEAMLAYYEDNEWCFRIGRTRSGCFRRSREALVLHHATPGPWGRKDLIGRANLVRFITAAAHFYRKHGLLLRTPGVDVFTIMPELARTNGTLDLAGARLVMELASTHSTDWLLMEWMNGGLDPVLGVERTKLGDELDSSRREADALRADLATARLDAETIRLKSESERHAYEEISARLQGIYESRLWKMGGSYDRIRRRARRGLP